MSMGIQWRLSPSRNFGDPGAPVGARNVVRETAPIPTRASPGQETASYTRGETVKKYLAGILFAVMLLTLPGLAVLAQQGGGSSTTGRNGATMNGARNARGATGTRRRRQPM